MDNAIIAGAQDASPDVPNWPTKYWVVVFAVPPVVLPNFSSTTTPTPMMMAKATRPHANPIKF